MKKINIGFISGEGDLIYKVVNRATGIKRYVVLNYLFQFVAFNSQVVVEDFAPGITFKSFDFTGASGQIDINQNFTDFEIIELEAVEGTDHTGIVMHPIAIDGIKCKNKNTMALIPGVSIAYIVSSGEDKNSGTTLVYSLGKSVDGLKNYTTYEFGVTFQEMLNIIFRIV